MSLPERRPPHGAAGDTIVPPVRGSAGAPNRLAAALAQHGPALLAGAVGLAWFAVHVGAGVLDPTRVGWLLGADWAPTYLGWAFFRHAPLGFPLGTNPEFPYGVGSALAFSDSIPIVGAIFRPFSPLLPAHFQYVGPWIALCFALQGFVGAKLVALVTDDARSQALGGALFALAPPLLHRVLGPHTGHASLCAHWLLLSSLWLALAPVDRSRAPRRIVGTAALVLLATGVHPYHAAASVAIAAALLARLLVVERVIGWHFAAGAGAAIATTAAVGLYAFGYFTPGVPAATSGFGVYSADALTLVNPMGWSRLWPGVAVGEGQYEGFGYLGAGVLALAAVGAVVAIRTSRRRSHVAAPRWRAALPVVAVAVLLSAFSLSDSITFAGEHLASVGAYAWAPAIRGALRSSGRFVWSLHYLVVLAAVGAAAFAFRARPSVLAALLGAAIVLQVADVRPPVPLPPSNGSWLAPAEGAWAAARGTYRHVALVPPLLRTGSGTVSRECPIAFQPDDYVPLAELAYGISATFNSGYFARLDPVRAGAACADLRAALDAGRLDPDTIYVAHPAYRDLLRAAGASCGVLGGIPACVRGGRPGPVADAIRANPPE